jgi:hypothetical protein
MAFIGIKPERGIGKAWTAVQVIRVRERLDHSS